MADFHAGGDKSPTCPRCRRRFATFGGRRVHERMQHEREFHEEEIRAQATKRTKARWDVEELNMIAAFEAAHPDLTTTINQEIRDKVLPGRTIESIKSRRRMDSYKELVLRSARAASEPDIVSSSTTRRTTRSQRRPALAGIGEVEVEGEAAPATTSARRAASGIQPTAQPQVRLPSPVRPPPEEAVQSIREHLTLLSNTLDLRPPRGIAEVEAAMEEWLPSKPYVYKASRMGAAEELGCRKRRATAYRRTQKQWKKDRGRAVRNILAGVPDGQPAQPLGLQTFWTDLFSRSSPTERRRPRPIRSMEEPSPITPEELSTAIGGTKHDTSPGPDGRCLEDLKQLDPAKLLWAFNSILHFEDVPTGWTKGKTTLIPKVNSPTQPGEYRPITVTSLLLRTFNKIIAARLMKAAPLPSRQKGFAPEEGVAANLLLIQELIKERTTNNDSLCIAFIDFQKAFDSVGHPSLLAATKRWGLPTSLTNYIKNLYKKASTNIMGADVKITRGVLQGDPLSPYLFNICLDWALASLPAGVGASLAGEMLPYIAYADDVALTARTPLGLQALIDALVDGAGRVGLELGHKKCATINIFGDKKRKRWLVDSTKTFTASNSPLKCLQPGQAYKYLGIEIGPTRNPGEPRRSLTALIKDLGLLQKAPLKPQQKLWALKTVVIPKHQYTRVIGKTTKGTLQRLDLEIRKFLKKALHLPKDTPNAGLYTKVGDGGLGVPRFITLVPGLKRGLLERLSKSPDASVAKIAKSWIAPNTTSAKDLFKTANLHHRTQLYATIDGRGMTEAPTTPSNNTWVDDGTQLMKGATYVDCLKIRLGVINTRIRASRGRQGAPTTCDLGCGRVESLGHILQSCPVLAPERTKRHDNTLALLVKILEKKNLKIIREPTIRTAAGARKPDVVVWDGLRSVVLDVQIVADSACGPTLDGAHALKTSYYNTGDISEWVQKETGHLPSYTSLTFNWRGLLANASMSALQDLGLYKPDIKLLTVRSLEGSVALIRAHRDFGGWGRH